MTKNDKMLSAVSAYIEERGCTGIENVLESMKAGLESIIDDLEVEHYNDGLTEEKTERFQRLCRSMQIIYTALDENRDDAATEFRIQMEELRAKKRSDAAKKAARTRKFNKKNAA